MTEDRYTRITLRIPRELDERLNLEAEKASKSKNAEIVARLEKSFGALFVEQLDPQSAEVLTKKLEELHQEFGAMRETYAEASEFIRELREMDAKKG